MTSAPSIQPAPDTSPPPAIVLCQSVTGLATVRALAQAGVEVHCFLLGENEVTRFSRYGKKVPLYGRHRDPQFLLPFLIDYSTTLGRRPVVFPSSDRMALFLASHADRLRASCTFSSTTYEDLANLVSKDGFYRLAAAADANTIPHIVTQDAAAVAAWSLAQPGPYLLKPFYDSIDVERPFGKNTVLATREDLLDYVARHGLRSVIVQRMIMGGDGNIFDCYGYCDADGRVLTMASHRRLRQNPPNFGTTCFGEIPANFGAAAEQQIFRNTERLLAKVRYHGIFGIEWLHERTTGRFFVIDFNARPFTTIGHLHACGLNLPLLAYRELTGRLPANIERAPVLKHMLWMDLMRDMVSVHEVERNVLTAMFVWLVSFFRCRSFAYLTWRDPGPGVARKLALVKKFTTYLGKKL